MLNDLHKALEVLSDGGVILYPTDTIWGIGCDATNEIAVDRIYAMKKRQDVKSMIILLDSETKLSQYIKQLPEVALKMIAGTKKPLTIIYPGAQNIARNVIAEDGSVGIRIIKEEFCKTLIRKFGKPIVSTSANISGLPWPVNFSNIDQTIRKSVDYIVKWRQNETAHGKPSGVIKIGLNGKTEVIRE